jgi:hypothetical protein
MTITVLSNPQSFKKDCQKVGVTLNLLQEALICIGAQALSRMFVGKCKRGGGSTLSSAHLETWIHTLQYAQDHSDEKDKDNYVPRNIEPYPEWYDFVKLVKTPIQEDLLEKWKSMAKTTLGKEARQYGFTIGISNNKALNDIHERMSSMYERRKKNFWNVVEVPLIEDEDLDYNKLNIFQLRELCKSRKISQCHLSKQELIEKLSEETVPEVVNMTYEEMNMSQLKIVSKERGMVVYNNLKKDELIANLKLLDEEEEKKQAEKDKITLCGIEIISRTDDGYINATQLCKAGGKLFKNWYQLDKSKEFLEELSTAAGIPATMLIQIGSGTNFGSNNTHTWVHPKVAINIAQWISPKFAVQVSEWIYELLSTGSVKLERPVKALTSLTELDIEAEVLENSINFAELTNCIALYIASIGKKMVKVGYTDSKLIPRLDKHQNSESSYEQWRIVSVIQISSKSMENLVHDFLAGYRVVFGRQKEIYKVNGTLTGFVKQVEDFLKVNDTKMTVEKLERELTKVKEELMLLKLENMELKLKLKIKMN